MAEQRTSKSSIKSEQTPAGIEDVRTGLSENAILRAFVDNLFYLQGRFPEAASVDDMYKALAYTVRDRLQQRWVGTARAYQQHNPRTVCYFSAEYLPGPFMGNNLLNLGIEESTRKALAVLGIDLAALIQLGKAQEPLANAGNGHLVQRSRGFLAIPLRSRPRAGGGPISARRA